MKRRSGLQEEDEDDTRGSIRLPSTGRKSSTAAVAKMPNVGEETKTTTVEMKVATTSSNVDIVDINNNSYSNDEKELSATEKNQKINQDNVLRGISFQEYENREISMIDENSNASDASISDRPGAFAVQGPQFNAYNATEDGTVQYSTTEAIETDTQTQEAEAGKPTINDPLEAERVLETVQGTSVTLNHQNDSTRTKWKQLTIILGIFVFALCAVAAVLIALFVQSNKNGNKSIPPPPSTPPVVATVASPSPTALPIFDPSTIPSAAPTSVQERIVTLLLEYFPDLPASNDQQQSLAWILTDPISLGVIIEDEGMTSSNQERVLLERFVLVTVYFATNGIGWRHNNFWLSPSLVCRWHGIECEGNATVEQTFISYIDLGNNRLSGSIPTGLGLMTSMTALSLYGNALSGVIPTELGLMTSMTGLALYDNALTGSIPTELGFMTSMTWLDLYDNALSGSIPTELGFITSMEVLFLDGNALSGSIPTELGFMTSMTRLDLDNNYLFGSIPTELGFITNMRILNLDDNILTGSIPTEIGLLTRLTKFGLSGNRNLTGTIPSEVVTILPNLLVCYMGNTSLIDIPEKCQRIATFL